MAEQTFRSPNFFDREIDLSGRTPNPPTGTPAGLIGTSNKGPAFVPVTVGNFDDFATTFGDLNPDHPAVYAANQFLSNRTSLTFLKVLGAGANSSSADSDYTKNYGRVVNAGFTLPPTNSNGGVYFISTTEVPTVSESYGFPIFNDNDSFAAYDNSGSNNLLGTQGMQLIRAMMMLPNTARFLTFGSGSSVTEAAVNATTNDNAWLTSGPLDGNAGDYYFKLVLSSSDADFNAYNTGDGVKGIKIFSASLNPSSPNYVGKVLNADPKKFAEKQHLLYAHFPVDHQLAVPVSASLLSGTQNASLVDSSIKYRELFGHFDTRFTTPASPVFISQPFGDKEFDLFHFEALDDGEFANKLYKISVANVKVSADPTNPYGTFSIQVRDWNDSDVSLSVLEQYDNCDLNPDSPNYVAKLIGDMKTYFNFDVSDLAERRLLIDGNFENVSKRVRIVMNDDVKTKKVPAKVVPFGFRGVKVLRTTDGINAVSGTVNDTATVLERSAGKVAAILPPIPYRVKLTTGQVNMSGDLFDASKYEVLKPSLYWGVKFERNTDVLNANSVVERNELLDNYTKFLGISGLGTLVDQDTADRLNNNKFSLSKVVLDVQNLNDVTQSAESHMLRSAYIRNGAVDPSEYKMVDTTNNISTAQVTLASLVNATDNSYTNNTVNIVAASNFNRFAQFTKFTTFMYGGFDGTNLLDNDARLLNEKSLSFIDASADGTPGGASVQYEMPGFANFNPSGVKDKNASVNSYKTAIDIMTDPYTVATNILAVPGIRESFVTDYASEKVRDYGLALYLMDIPALDDGGSVIFDGTTIKPNIENTAAALEGRNIDNDYVATYFPDVFVDDATNRRRVKVPASVAALSALGFNDRVSYPWFAPAGFNRAALDFVTNVAVRLNVTDRDRLYDAKINPIATFPRQGFVIYGQKTIKAKKSALDRVNVRRLLLEVKRIISNIATNLIFEQNTPALRNKFVADATVQLGLIQAQAGIEASQVVMNESNNTQDDIDNNRLNGRVVIVPTRAIEFIAIDFIVTNSGVQFV